ncbi:hypothetical protein NUW58_g1727 [Xylaria curta]|uniref:Uncharacterized protein n=1 Tax=Xylaria curta TaxID=42375 RepID=A0ACC1PJ17_9PEZI|nr:hypothetical protein NUW58_g1727 [Xylaria curta]
MPIIQQDTSPTGAEAPKATITLELNAGERHSRPLTLRNNCLQRSPRTERDNTQTISRTDHAAKRSKSAEQRRALDFPLACWHDISKVWLNFVPGENSTTQTTLDDKETKMTYDGKTYTYSSNYHDANPSSMPTTTHRRPLGLN